MSGLSPEVGRSRAVGVLFDRSHRPTELPGFVRVAERMGLDDVWFVEDVGWAGAVAQTATALAHTQRLRIGMGMCPVPLRNPMTLAMEVAALAELYPRRLVAGIGHGSAHRIARITHPVRSRMAHLEASFNVIRAVLAGKSASADVEAFTFSDAHLEHFPPEPPPLFIGAVSPRTLALSGRVADGTILAEGTTPDVLRRDLAFIASGRPHEIVVYALVLVDRDADTEVVHGFVEKFAALHRIAPEPGVILAGSADAVAKQIGDLWDAGAHTVVLRPIGDDPLNQVAAALRALGR